ncbi:diphosphomevalonate decarboxylase [Enterococcus haemoperoxidus ATCC BAA-382]|uniref:diphosphomevalonate decarboxylase n=1 Tax=Enterococcus haemoperoxidus ATCC BAA-382 TaxID=1158608 RepID=R2QA23_9ENTE|nr:diphosphomevalonate decarboxylase [Enterococcus haemoperoxidus]EOH93272.1 diphosphomevalonate decarboxylase [Enterococcus haemoperoxidus ATCC BAA-382]EOT61227.1 diphosphomevalonate decarboxylase [Enterococcus haemoperoxidus ATCC BAA-382]OJG54407.1 diphosphomevalonate decarboxylase [Enterococcus haemoperoxidus]
MYVGKARAYTNIALIKYWGKKDERLILPMNSSLSLTLDAFYTETSVYFDKSLTEDLFVLDGKKQDSKQTAKISKFLDLIRQQQNLSLFARVDSQNFVPTAAGLASSASGLAALAGACSEALDLQLTETELSRLARRGSGSACRSIFGGFAEWQKGDSDQTSFAKAIPSEGWENELAMLFVLVDDGVKDISSRDGMKRTVETSSFYSGWLENVEADLAIAKEAIKERDFNKLGEVAEANGLRMHGTTLAAVPPFTYWSPESLNVMQLVRSARQAGLPCYFTMDAGPNVKILVEKKNLTALKNFLAEYLPEQKLITAFAGPGIEAIPIERSEDL